MSNDVELDKVFEVYGQVLADPSFQSGLLEDLEATGGTRKVTVEQFAASVLPKVVTCDILGNEIPPSAPLLYEWERQVHIGYRALNIPARKNTGIANYLKLLREFRDHNVSSPNSNNSYVPIEDRQNDLYNIGHRAIRSMVLQANTPPLESGSRVVRSGDTPKEASVVRVDRKVKLDRAILRDELALDRKNRRK